MTVSRRPRSIPAVETMTRFTRWLVDNGYRVRLFGGDNKFDGEIAEKIKADLRRYRPDLSRHGHHRSCLDLPGTHPGHGTRRHGRGHAYHNVMCALKLCKPTISLGYSRKFISLMADMGLAEFHQFADSLDLDRLIEQFKELESRHAELQPKMAERNAAHRQSLADQFAVLSGLLLPASKPAHAGAADDGLARSGLS